MARRFKSPDLVHRWFVYKRHEIREGVLVGTQGRNDKPGPISDAPQQLVFVHRRVIDPIQFSNAFGQLGYTRLCQPDDRRGGDPMEWFMAHANTVSTILDLVGFIKHPPQRFQLRGPIAYGEQISGPPHTVFPTKTPMQEKTRFYLKRFLNGNLRGVGRIFLEHESTSKFEVRTLIEGIYWYLADLIDSGWFPERCAECGEFFISTDPRQKYCPATITSERSRCSSRLNFRNFERRKERENHERR